MDRKPEERAVKEEGDERAPDRLRGPKPIMTAPTPSGGEAALDVPGATRLTLDDWAEMITDIADAWERDSLTADDKAGGYKLQMSEDLRAFARWFPAALLAARRGEALLAVFDKHRDLIAHVRPGRNRIGVDTGGWLVCKTFEGPEEHVRTFREAVELACKALGITAALAATPEEKC